jgi:hypothetical protein
MKNGDIANEVPPRIIVVIDVVADSSVEETRKLLKTTVERTGIKLKNRTLSQLWNISFNYSLSVELAAFQSEHWTQENLDAFMNRLDSRGGNPFNYAELYADIDDFIGELPYRTNLKGVVDLRERVMRYGSWGIELDNL